jgi:AcrR family transcriptional regulator
MTQAGTQTGQTLETGQSLQTRRPVAGAAVLREEITLAIRRAVVEELAAVGYGRLSIEAVARRAGVGKTAIYRRWSSKLDLVLELVSGAAAAKLALPDTGSLRTDLELVLVMLSKALRHPLASQIIPDLLAEAARNPGIAETLQHALRRNQREVGLRLLGAAAQRGELPDDLDPEAAIDMIIGSLYWRLIVSRVEVTNEYLAGLATLITTALTRTPPP